MTDNTLTLGIDTGGTFTDFVLLDKDKIRVHKVLSTPHAPEQAILKGIADLGLKNERLAIVHGSTVATNAALEGKGVRTAYITNYGLRDTLTIGRQARRELYNLQPGPTPPPVPRELCLETGGRLAADGSVVEPLTKKELETLKQQLIALDPQAVAINLLFSFLDDQFEKDIEAIVPNNIFVSRSSHILPEYKEYERGITTWLNSWVGPIVEQYLGQLTHVLPDSKISVMQSSGGTIDANHAGKLAVHMLLSGPAGGLAGARFIAERAGNERVLTFDIGGTSTDVAMIDGDLRLTSEGHIGPYPVAIPMVDMHTIGAGGGSIAYIDEGGLLQVGPESAGAAPGPACYGQGGIVPTVTDANLILGRLRSEAFLGGKMMLDSDAARKAIQPIAENLKISIEETASGIIRIANEHMAQALRVISVQRGYDPREFTLISFGGAGGLHVCALAEALGMNKAMVPIQAGVLSALGMLVAPRARQLSQTIGILFDDISDEDINTHLQALGSQGRHALVEEGVEDKQIVVKNTVDLRYQGQSYTINIEWQNREQTSSEFHQTHQQHYGHKLDLPVEMVNVRVALHGPVMPIQLGSAADSKTENKTPSPTNKVTLYGINDDVYVFERDKLVNGQIINGPALITEAISTSFIAPGWTCSNDKYGNLLLEKT